LQRERGARPVSFWEDGLNSPHRQKAISQAGEESLSALAQVQNLHSNAEFAADHSSLL
jgi:hypothetical protein